MKTKIYVLLILVLTATRGFSQINGVIRGNVKDKNTQETIIGAVISVDGTTNGTATDIDGNFKINVPVGTYNLKASYLGFTTLIKYNISVTSGNAQTVNFELEAASSDLNEVTVTFDKGKSAVATDMITPLSVQQLTTEEIKSNPGGSFDVSRVVQTLPGVGGSGGGAARNDIIIRGGAPNENVYYVDGIEIPVLNHFQTQGSSGGAQGILNVSFIEDVKLSSSAFDAKYDNTLASTFIIKQRQGNPEKLSGNVRVSFTEAVATLEGPLGKKTDFLISGRKSYLDLLFKLIDLPIRPNFYDFQYKVTHKFNDKTTLTALGVGAIDNFSFGTTRNTTPENEYFRRSLPIINQWNYTTGFTLKRLINKGYINFALSRNMFNNQLDRFEDAQYNDETKRNFKLRSQEIENKFRMDVNKYIDGWKISYGAVGQYVKYNTNLFNKLSSTIYDSTGNVIFPGLSLNFRSDMEFFKYGAFGQVAKNIFNEKLLVSLGLRTDMNSFIKDGNNPLNALSPRFSMAYHVTKKFDITGSVGTYYKIPTYTSLGYKDANGEFVNKSMKYIQSNHYVLGTQFLPNEALRFTLEGFYKQYNNYPVSKANGTSLANQGTDFGSIGSEAIQSTGKGETYGVEFFVQQKLVKKIFYVFSYTYVRSRYSGIDNKLIASSWDNQHLISTTLGYKFGKNWQLGLKYRFAGGTPYTPFDLNASQQNFALLGTGILDYSNINTLRLNNFNQLDFRSDKKINFKKTSLNLFIDFQNVLMSVQYGAPYYTFKRTADNSGFETTDGKPLKTDGSNGIPIILKNESKTVTPSIGFTFEF
ncbi:MAG: TonB-dependent receptor [Bacteroidia bacterium]|nr:TonB-dependent receptor [Bacteroidia bacterium]